MVTGTQKAEIWFKDGSIVLLLVPTPSPYHLMITPEHLLVPNLRGEGLDQQTYWLSFGTYAWLDMLRPGASAFRKIRHLDDGAAVYEEDQL